MPPNIAVYGLYLKNNIPTQIHVHLCKLRSDFWTLFVTVNTTTTQRNKFFYFKLNIPCKACARNQRRLFEASTRQKRKFYMYIRQVNGVEYLQSSHPYRYPHTGADGTRELQKTDKCNRDTCLGRFFCVFFEAEPRFGVKIMPRLTRPAVSLFPQSHRRISFSLSVLQFS